MPPFLRKAPSRGKAMRLFVAWLVVALVGAQSLGHRHGIAHAHCAISGVAPSAFGASPIAAEEGDFASGPTQQHSCAAFEAATLGSAATSSFHFDFLSFGALAPPVALSRFDPELFFALGYLSRAPPIDLALN